MNDERNNHNEQPQKEDLNLNSNLNENIDNASNSDFYNPDAFNSANAPENADKDAFDLSNDSASNLDDMRNNGMNNVKDLKDGGNSTSKSEIPSSPDVKNDAQNAANSAKDAAGEAAKEAGKEAGKEASKQAAETAADTASDAAGGNPVSQAKDTVKTPLNVKESYQEAETQDAEQNMKDVVKDTVLIAPRVAADAVTYNVPGLVVDAVDYASKTAIKIFKIIPVIILVIAVLVLTVVGSISTLPSMIINAADQKIDELQINHAQELIEDFYTDRISEIVSDTISKIKSESEISSFTFWKRIVNGKNDKYSVNVNRLNETDALVTVTNNAKEAEIQIVFDNIYLTDYSEYKLAKFALINSYMYKSAFGKTEEFLRGEPVPYENILEADDSNRWRSSDSTELKKWLKDNKDILVKLDTKSSNVVNEGGKKIYKYEFDVSGIITEDQIYAHLGFTETQCEQLKEINFAKDVYLGMIEAYEENNELNILYNIYPKLDVYTNLFGPADTMIWPMLPTDYQMLIAAGDEKSNETFIREIVAIFKRETTTTDEIPKKYTDWYGHANGNWDTKFIDWCFNELDKKIENDIPIIGNIVNKTSSVDDMTAFLFEHNSGWHYKKDNYIPQPGDFVVIYAPNQHIHSDGTVTTDEKDTVFNITKNDKVTDKNLKVSSLGMVESASGGAVKFIFANQDGGKVETGILELTDSKIIAYVTPNYESVIKEDENIVYSGETFEAGEWPLPFKGTLTVSAGYPKYSRGGEHHGIDFKCNIGTQIFAINSGIVDFAGKGTGVNWSFGNFVRIKHTTSTGVYYTVYAHLSKVLCKTGDKVVAGDLIGLSGNTGNVSPAPTPANPTAGAHLHLGIYKGTKSNYDDPKKYLKQGGSLYKGRTVTGP